MKEDDSHGTDQSAIDADAAGPISGSARVKARSETRAHQLRNIVLGLKDLLVENDIDRVTAALIIGRLALDFEHSQWIVAILKYVFNYRSMFFFIFQLFVICC